MTETSGEHFTYRTDRNEENVSGYNNINSAVVITRKDYHIILVLLVIYGLAQVL